jgi:hypothetical protein
LYTINDETEKRGGRALHILNLVTLLWPGKEVLWMMGTTTLEACHSQPTFIFPSSLMPPIPTSLKYPSLADAITWLSPGPTNIHTNNNTPCLHISELSKCGYYNNTDVKRIANWFTQKIRKCNRTGRRKSTRLV